MVKTTCFDYSLKNGSITIPVLTDAIYTVDKRAEYFCDKERRYRDADRLRRRLNPDFFDKYDNAGRAEKRKEYFYRQKDIMLKVIGVFGIHIFAHDVYLYYYCRDYSFHEPVRIGGEKDVDFDKILDWAMEKYPELTVTEVSDIRTLDSDKHDILSCQFVDKLVALIESGNYRYCRNGGFKSFCDYLNFIEKYGSEALWE